MKKKLKGKAVLFGLAWFSFKYESDEPAKKKTKRSKNKKRKK